MSSNDNNVNEKSNDGDNIIEAIGSTVLGVQDSFGSVYNSLEKSLQQNLQMSQSMIHMIEEVYKANIKIGSSLKPAGNGNIYMSLMISNRTKLPITSMSGVLKFDTEEEVNITYFDALQKSEDSLNQQLPSIFESSCNLMPQTQYIQEIEIKLKRVVQCNGLFVLHFQNPVDGKQIELKHSFGLYLIDQFKKEIINDCDNPSVEVIDQLCYPVAFIREMMQIHPVKGIEVGMRIQLTSSKVHIICKIINIADDYNTAEVEFSSNTRELVAKLIMELNMLCSSSL
ncbi:MAG: hypothetical protein EXX96DRAFT_582278 [Benjaminiella poitrasii]|nr:MAG: hypothetical protein EXX96DRAFT_582278 [Benjaminiella poitrasii]